MDMTEKELKEGAKAIKELTLLALATLRAKKLKLTEKQKEVLSKVINDKIGSCMDYRSEASLLKKGYIVKKAIKDVKHDKSLYLINF